MYGLVSGFFFQPITSKVKLLPLTFYFVVHQDIASSLETQAMLTIETAQHPIITHQ